LPGWVSKGVARLIVGSAFVYPRLRYGLDFRQVKPMTAMEQTKNQFAQGVLGAPSTL